MYNVLKSSLSLVRSGMAVVIKQLLLAYQHQHQSYLAIFPLKHLCFQRIGVWPGCVPLHGAQRPWAASAWGLLFCDDKPQSRRVGLKPNGSNILLR